jgi:ribosome biogenesis GTPase / thiamine phosphate phosphatase
MLHNTPEALLRLQSIGLKPVSLNRLHQHFAHSEEADLPALLRLVEVQREHLVLHDGQHTLRARPLPAVLQGLAAHADALAVGDWVLARQNALSEWWVVHRLPPLNQLARRHHDGRDKVERQVIVANVDAALIVMGLDHDFNVRRLERYLAALRLADIEAVVVLSKADQCSDVASRLDEAAAVVPCWP